MSKPANTPPDWGRLVGGDDAEAWHDDRRRKVGRITEAAQRIFDLARTLNGLGGLRCCTAAILRECPEAGEWYVALAGYSNKTLKSVGAIRLADGSALPVESILRRLRSNRGSLTAKHIENFCTWVNAEIKAALPHPPKTAEEYALHVAMIEGGRIIGQGQNEGGALALELLKTELLLQIGLGEWEFEDADGGFRPENDAAKALLANRWRHRKTGATPDFTGGPNRADVGVTNRRGKVTLVAEVKGRKDLSNTWESWMPQVADHLKTWKESFPDAKRGVFMTVITKEMIDGMSKHGTKRTGLRGLHDAGLLDFAINLSSFDAETGRFLRDAFLEAMTV